MMIGSKLTGSQHRGHRGTLWLQPHFPQEDRQAPRPTHPPRSPGRCLLNPQSTLTSSGCFRKHRAAFPACYHPKKAKKRLIGHSFSTTSCPEGGLEVCPQTLGSTAWQQSIHRRLHIILRPDEILIVLPSSPTDLSSLHKKLPGIPYGNGRCSSPFVKEKKW